ncbi:hypothetical protein SLUN_01615 [Streptomyces lunaelactis]|uniref:DUF4386 domain-containing protein n=1 Tax=Streptomyces lunaelactis TaxID=1535768 RepID=A0A2R4SW87_9ACTN|nr:hypothetical protein [Streptomyces lunaelactis]AVZ71141.1 hypothetical protein SLUN_01615 [Streptomyces lunaelactis]NUK05802.1 hypothetical protein [Streptomyces lunaelactis]NUK12378.1 hypothetical protein [Streptomyces lunaelactis]NUK20637.1 hypothetical protein [Streptomyces lunaelactis]NUK28195.1 hypothetical protein [Streptomyces lunaelactis]
MTTIDPTATGSTAHQDGGVRPKWPLYGVGAGLLGAIATLFADVRSGTQQREFVDATITDEVSRGIAHLGLVTGFATVVLLLVLAAAWRRQVEPRVPGSTAAYVVSGALTASAAGLTYGYGWKGAMAIYLPTGMDKKSFGEDGLFVYYMLNDFGGFIGWLGVVVAAGAVAWMALRERTVSRWIGWVSLVPVLAVVLFAGITGLPGFQGVVGPVWMLVAFLGLALGRSAIVR